MSSVDPRAPLIPNVSQYEVDFVIPRVGIDLPLGIDPFLLFKSRDSQFRQLHVSLLNVFNAGILAVRNNDLTTARYLFSFPEVSAIGMGYTRKGKRGSGVGSHLTELILQTLAGSPSLTERGVRHVEEMQLLSSGIGPDRISDISANVLTRPANRHKSPSLQMSEVDPRNPSRRTTAPNPPPGLGAGIRLRSRLAYLKMRPIPTSPK